MVPNGKYANVLRNLPGMEFLRRQVRNFLPASCRFLALFANLCIVCLAKSFVRRSGTRSAGSFGLASFRLFSILIKRRNMRKAIRLTETIQLIAF
jgi:hypothetical protein